MSTWLSHSSVGNFRSDDPLSCSSAYFFRIQLSFGLSKMPKILYVSDCIFLPSRLTGQINFAWILRLVLALYSGACHAAKDWPVEALRVSSANCMSGYHVSPELNGDIFEIWRWIARDSVELADRLTLSCTRFSKS